MTPPDLRQRIEQVLTAHFPHTFHDEQYRQTTHWCWCNDLSRKLAALYPLAPSREALELLLTKRLIAIGQNGIDLCQPFVDELMAWATGMETEKKCETCGQSLPKM